MGLLKIPRQEHEIRARAERETLFWETLKRYTKKGKFQRPRGVVTVFDLACGTAEEAMALAAFFSSGVPGVATQKCELYLVEAEKEALDAAMDTLNETLPGASFTSVPSVRLVVGDCQRLETLGLPAVADFILIRHQFIGKDKDDRTDVWGGIFESAVRNLAPGGLLLITSFSMLEHDWALVRLQAVSGVRIVCAEKNPHSIPLNDTRPIAGDHFVILVRKS